MPNTKITNDMQLGKQTKAGTYGTKTPNLVVKISKTGRKTFYFRMLNPFTGTTKPKKLGVYNDMSFKQARDTVEELRSLVRQGKDIENKLRPKAKADFITIAREWFDIHSKSWDSAAHTRKIKRIIEVRFKTFHDRAIETITMHEVAEVLSPIWNMHIDIANKALSTIRLIGKYAYAAKLAPASENLGDRDFMNLILGKQTKKSISHPSLSPEKVPLFLKKLRESPVWDEKRLQCLLIELYILTFGSRISPVIFMRFSEINFDECVWDIPAHKMKSDRPFNIPLPKRAMEILKQLRKETIDDYVFPNPNAPKSGFFSTTALSDICHKNLGYSAEEMSMHGFRGSFRTWALKNKKDRSLAETSMAHLIGGAEENTYINILETVEDRRELIYEYEVHCLSEINKVEEGECLA